MSSMFTSEKTILEPCPKMPKKPVIRPISYPIDTIPFFELPPRAIYSSEINNIDVKRMIEDTQEGTDVQIWDRN